MALNKPNTHHKMNNGIFRTPEIKINLITIIKAVRIILKWLHQQKVKAMCNFSKESKSDETGTEKSVVIWRQLSRDQLRTLGMRK